MTLPATLTRDRSALVYIKEETTPGTMTAMPAGTDALKVVNPPMLIQKNNYTELSETGTSLLTVDKIRNFAEYCDFDLEFYSRPNGSAGSAPDEDVLLEHFLGTKTTDAGVDVEYTFSNTIQTASVFSRTGTGTSIALDVAVGAIPTKLDLNLSRDGAVTWRMGMRSNRIYHAATAEVSAFASGSPDTVTVDAPKRNAATDMIAADVLFDTLTVDIVQSDGSALSGGAVSSKAISSVSTTAGTFTCTIDQGVTEGTPADGDLVVPVLASPTISTKSPLSQEKVTVFIAAQDADDGTASDNTDLFHADNKVPCIGLSLSFDRGVQAPLQKEMDGDEFPPATYLLDQINITGSLDVIVRPNDMARFFAGLDAAPVRSLGIQIGSTAGRIIEMYIPGAHLEKPDRSVESGARKITVNFKVVSGTKTTDATKFILRYR